MFKLRRTSPFDIFSETMDEAERFKGLIEKTKCPNTNCKNLLKVVKFERGPKGWEADVECENCNFTLVVSSLASVAQGLNSKGKAVA